MAFVAASHHEAVVHASAPSHNSTTSSEWGPYSGPGDFSANMVITIVVLFSALILGLAINFFIRFLLCSSRLRRHADDDPEKQAPSPSPSPMDSLPTLVFSAGTKLAGAEAECAICLAEFAEGDTVRVMPACNHGFHVRCIERWLASRLSCPTCRTACLAPVAPPPGVSSVEAA